MAKHSRVEGAKGTDAQNKPEHKPEHGSKKTAKDTGYVGKHRGE